MGNLQPLSDFFDAIEKDPRISITHIGIYAALLQFWKEQEYKNPLSIYSYDLMRKAKISVCTYHKMIRDLNNYGYLRYEPSFYSKEASKIYFIVHLEGYSAISLTG